MPDISLEVQKQRAVKEVKVRYNNSKKANSLDFERFSRYYKLFRNRQVKKNYQGLANLFIPEPYRIIRKKTARLANAIRSIKVESQSPNDNNNAKINEALLNFLRRKLDWSMIERIAIQESRIVGLSWIKILWDLGKEEESQPYKGFDMSFQTADKVYLNPEATMLDVFSGDIRWLINEYEADLDFLVKNPNYDTETLALLRISQNSGRTEKNPLSQSRLMNEKTDERVKKIFKIMEYWGKFSPEENGDEEDYLIVIANDSFVLRFDTNPYKEVLQNPIPFVPIVANVVGQEMYPVGDIEPGESLFNELNDTRNQRMDTVTLNIDPAKEIIRAAQIDEKELIARRGWVIHSNIAGGVRFVPPDLQGARAAIDEERAIRGDIQQYSGVIDFAPGAEVQAGVSIDTARGTIIAKGEADVLIEDEINTLKVSLRMLYRIVLAYAQSFLDRNFIIRLLEKGQENFVEVNQDSIKGNFDLDIEMKTLQDKTTDQQLKLLMFNNAKTVPGAKLGRFFTDVLESFYENVNIDDYYQEPQPTQQAPNVSISLRGDLNPAEIDEIYKMTGGDPKAADPLFREEFRKVLHTGLPELQPPQPTQ